MKPEYISLCILIMCFSPALICWDDCYAQVTINEVLYDPDGVDTGNEFIELFNNTTSIVDLTGFELKLADSNYFTFPNFQLNPNIWVTIHNNAEGENTETDLFTGLLANMGNTRGSVALFSGTHSSTNIVDFLQYGDSNQQWESAAVNQGIWEDNAFTPDVEEGMSLNLNPDGSDTNQISDWSICVPSAGNSNCPESTPIPTPSVTDTPNPTATPTPSPSFTPTPHPTQNSPTPTNPPPTNTPTFSPPHTPTSTHTPTPTATNTPAPTAEPNFVVINEIYYDAPGSDTGLEWIEFLNVGQLPIELSGYDLKPDDAPYFTFPEFTLDPGSRVIVHINTDGTNTDSELYAGANGTGMGNTSGSIALFINQTHSVETILDFVQYGAAGQTWENTAVDAGIWTDGDFTIDAFEGLSLNLDPDGFDNNNSQDWNECTPSSLQINCPQSTFTPTAFPTSPYTPTPTNTAHPPTSTPTVSIPTDTPTPEPEIMIVLNEILYDPAGSDSGNEFIEIINIGDTVVDMTGFDLKADNAGYFTFPEFQLLPQRRVVIHVDAIGPNSETELYMGETSSGMGNTSGSIALFTTSTHSASTIIDFMQYGAGNQTWESAAVTAGIWIENDFVSDTDEGYSLNLDPDGFDTNQSQNWNSCLPTLLDINCIVQTPTSTGTPIPTATGLETAVPTTSPTPLPPSGVVINEVFFDPEGADTGFEFVELYNPTTDPIDLLGFDLKPDDSTYYTFPSIVLDPEAYLTVHVNTSGTDTTTDLYTGPTTSMGNSSGFIALFNDTTHSTNTIIDYIAYGAGGQSWESTAVNAGIWTANDYAENASEGNSINLCPNGQDTNAGDDWLQDSPSEGAENPCQSQFTPSPTPTGGAPTATPSARLGLVLNEVLYDPEGTDTGLEYVELFNSGTEAEILTGFDLKADDSAYYTFPDFTLTPGSYVTVHINTSGTDTSTDLFTGTSGNMGNSTGFIALFNSTTHSSTTLIDYLEYGEDGQTWESAAIDAGIWTEGTFVIPADEGLSLSLCPNGEDYDTAANWQGDTPSQGGENPCNPPPATPTPTHTEGPSPTPTITPTPRPTVEPVIQLAGYAHTDYQLVSGGTLAILAWVTDPDNNVESVDAYLGGEVIFNLHDDGQHGDFDASDGIYGFETSLPASDVPSDDTLRLLLKIIARDQDGYQSLEWPFLTVQPGAGYYYSRHEYNTTPSWTSFEQQYQMTSATTGPTIFMAGYLNTRLTQNLGGTVTLVAVDADRNITDIEILYDGIQTGIFLKDDGLNGDFGPADGVFGIEFDLSPDDLPPGMYFLQLLPRNAAGDTGPVWPYLTLND